MTAKMNDEARLEARQAQRMRHEDKMIGLLDRREAQQDRDADALIGELQGEAGHRYYINLRTRDGRYTGKIKESRNRFELVRYLVRNNYI